MIEHQIERLGLAVAQGLKREPLRLCLETATPERPLDSAISVKNCLRSQLLRAGTLDTGDDAQSYGFATPCGLGQCVKDDVLHDTASLVRYK